MNSYVLGFQEIDKTKLAVVGGKGLNLEELSRIEGIRVPEGFCVTGLLSHRCLRSHFRLSLPDSWRKRDRFLVPLLIPVPLS